MSNTHPEIVVIGGGTGGFTLLGALKNYSKNITALVNMADDGGSTGQLRDELGVLPPGDVRKSLVALSQSPKVRDLFDYRFAEGTLQGHTFGNLFLTALEKMTGNFAEGVETASDILKIVGKVVPITLDNVHLVMVNPSGERIKGEHRIDVTKGQNLRDCTFLLEPEAHINPDAHKAIHNADLVVISAGDVYTSIGPSLSIQGVREALRTTKATIVYVCNLVTKPGQTTGLTVSQHAAEIERLAGNEILDYVLYNSAKPPVELFDKYVREGEYLVEIDEPALIAAHYTAVAAPLLSSSTSPMIKGDALAAGRSLIRHNGNAVAEQLIALCKGAVK